MGHGGVQAALLVAEFVAGGDQPSRGDTTARREPGEQAGQRPVRRLRDAVRGDRAGHLPGVRGGGDAPAGAGAPAMNASRRARASPGRKVTWAHAAAGADFSLGGEEVAGRGLRVEQGGLQQRRHHLLRDAGRGVLPLDAPPGDLVRRAARPGSEPQPVGEERPVRGEVLDHADFPCRGIRAAFPAGEDLVQVPGGHIGQPGSAGRGQLPQDEPELGELGVEAGELHRPGGARQLVDGDAAVEPRVQVLPDGAGMSGIGDGGEVDPGHLGGAGHEPADVPHVVGEPRAVELVPGADRGREHRGIGIDGAGRACRSPARRAGGTGCGSPARPGTVAGTAVAALMVTSGSPGDERAAMRCRRPRRRGVRRRAGLG